MFYLRNIASVQYTYVDGIRPGQNYVLCVQGRTSDDENAFGLQQTSERNCAMLLTGKNALFKALFIFFLQSITSVHGSSDRAIKPDNYFIVEF